jgi:alkanesulfonate monooxygenase SsuD/methylene tetrahydromethanopterin reductase-like flavin-dependent oxidoreductase (luciferase family)
MARAAEAHGLFGVLAGMGDPRTAITAAVYASTATDFVRIAVRVRLGLEHPVTIAEELAVLDNVNNGRTVLLADTGHLATEDAADELAVIREALGNRPLEHEGMRWKAPAGLPANATAPRAIAVTPKPAQLEVPVWITGNAGVEVARDVGLPALAQRLEGVSAQGTVQPALAPLRGSLDHDREMVGAWAAAGATHLLVELPAGADEAALMVMVSRHLAPEVAMPHFPRVMSNSRVPLPWPGDGRG